jgi:hypothetical protein
MIQTAAIAKGGYAGGTDFGLLPGLLLCSHRRGGGGA